MRNQDNQIPQKEASGGTFEQRKAINGFRQVIFLPKRNAGMCEYMDKELKRCANYSHSDWLTKYKPE